MICTGLRFLRQAQMENRNPRNGSRRSCHRPRRNYLLHHRPRLRLRHFRRRFSPHGIVLAAFPARRAKFRPLALLPLIPLKPSSRSHGVYRIGRDKSRNAATAFLRKCQCLVTVRGIPERCVFCIPDGVRPSLSPSFRLGSSTSVLLRVESILYPESYCSLGPTRIHFSFDQEDFFDWFRTPHYPALFHAPAAHCSLDHRGGRW